MNEKHQQKILRPNEEIDDLIANRHIARRRCFWQLAVPSKRIAEKFTHITLFDVYIDSLKNISDGLNFVTQAWRWLTNVMIQTPFTDGTGSKVKWSRNQTITTTILDWRKRSEHFLKLPWMSLFKTKEFCSLHHRPQNIIIKNIF